MNKYIEIICIKCGHKFKRDKWKAKFQIYRYFNHCRSCSSRLIIASCLGKSGKDNPAWKGGSAYWIKGRFGRDKDNLSWKIQRKLCWKRDNYTCRMCGVKTDIIPDCHHKIPYRISQSHALSNLISLCKSHHGIIEQNYKSTYSRSDYGITCVLSYCSISHIDVCSL